MKKHEESRLTLKGQKCKSSLHSHAQKSRRLIQKTQVNHNCHQLEINPANWYQLRKRAQQRLNTISNDNLIIIDNGYRGHHARIWLQNLNCEHVFQASLREVALVGGDTICPFCNGPTDMQHFGSIEAIAEHVHTLSMGNIGFVSSNELKGRDDEYQMTCHIHGHRFAIPFSTFLADPMSACDICVFENT